MILPVSSRKLPHHEIRIRSKTCICEAGRQNQGSLFNLPHQPAGLPPVREKLGKEFTCSQILETLRGLNMTLLSKDSGYIPSYKRTKLTDALHNAFGFRTDYEFISKSSMRSIIKETKQKK